MSAYLFHPDACLYASTLSSGTYIFKSADEPVNEEGVKFYSDLIDKLNHCSVCRITLNFKRDLGL